MTDTPTPWDPGSGEPVPPAQPAPRPPQAPGSMPPPAAHPPPTPHSGVPIQPPYQQPSTSYEPSPHERKKRKIWPWLLGAFAFMVLGVGGCSLIAYRTFKGPIDQANAFLAAVDDGDFASAAAMSAQDPSCFGDNPQQAIEEAFEGWSINDYDLTSVNVSSGSGASRSQASGTIDLEGLPTLPVEVNMLKEDGDWMICGFFVDP